MINHLLTPNAIEYTLEHLFRVAGFSKFNYSSIDFTYYPEIIRYNYFGIIIQFKIVNSNEITHLLSGLLTLNSIKTADSLYSIPIILEKGLQFVSFKDNELIVNADILTISFIMLSRFEEMTSIQHDEHGNFKSTDSIAMKYYFIDFPIVDEYAKLLQINIKKYFPNLSFRVTKCRIIPTHDIDEIFRYSYSFIGFRRIIKDFLVSLKSFKFYSISLRIIKSFVNPEKDPFFDSIKMLLNFSMDNNLRAEFYFMAANKNQYNSGYEISNKYLVNLIKLISNENMRIGIHGGYGTRNNHVLLNLEKSNLDVYLENPTIYGRQHYLHFDIFKTFKTIEFSGITHDSTLGYNNREGYRCGTCHSYRAWNFETDSSFNLIVRPLIVMDVNFWRNKKRSINEANAKIIFLFKRCKYVGGDFIINWHNVYVLNKQDWFLKVYCNTIRYMIKDLHNNDS